MRTILIWASACFAILSGGASANEKLSIVADEWPPFSGENLPSGGMSLDVISTVLRRAGYEVTTSVVPWARILSGARSGEFDIVGSLFFDAEVAEYMTYGDPFYSTKIKFVRRAGADISVTGYDDIRERSIAVGDGFLYEPTFDRDDSLDKLTVTTALQAMRMVAFGRANLTLDSEEVLRYISEIEDPALKDQVEILPFVLAEHDLHMAVRSDIENKDRIVADFNRILAEMIEDGSLAETLGKHVIDYSN